MALSDGRALLIKNVFFFEIRRRKITGGSTSKIIQIKQYKDMKVMQ